MLTTRTVDEIKNDNFSRNSPNSFFRLNYRKVDYAIFSPMPEELEFFIKTFAECKIEKVTIQEFELHIYEYRNKKILIAHTGLGTTFAASIMTLVHHHFSPEYILLTGTAGGIQAGLKLRDVVIVEKAFEAEIQGAFTLLKGTPFESCLTHPLKNQCFPQIYSADEELLEIASTISASDITIHRGAVVSSNTFPAPPELFQRIKSQNAYTIDMETSAFYQIGWLLNARVLAIRGVSNVLNHDGTDDKVHESDVKGSAEATAKVLLKIVDALLLKKEVGQTMEFKPNPEIKNEISELIKKFNLQPHPEGGHYARTFQSTDIVKSINKDRYDNEERNAGTAIYYLLKGNEFSAWHTLKSDEMWHFYRGSAVKIHVIDVEGKLSSHVLGDPLQHSGACFQVVIRAGNWFAAEIIDKGAYGLVGCTVTPGFEFKDFMIANRKDLVELFPKHSLVINQFTRVLGKDIEPQKCVI